VLNDAALVELAKRAPRSAEALEGVRGVNPGSLRRRGGDLLAAIARGTARAPIPVEAERREPSTPLDGPQIALAEALVRARALESGLAYELIAARADLAAIVCARSGRREPDVRTLTGWRRELVGEELLALLRGERTVAVAGDGRLSITPQ
jgi:ribonuclease D